jgi:hypothetical protein
MNILLLLSAYFVLQLRFAAHESHGQVLWIISMNVLNKFEQHFGISHLLKWLWLNRGPGIIQSVKWLAMG